MTHQLFPHYASALNQLVREFPTMGFLGVTGQDGQHRDALRVRLWCFGCERDACGGPIQGSYVDFMPVLLESVDTSTAMAGSLRDEIRRMFRCDHVAPAKAVTPGKSGDAMIVAYLDPFASQPEHIRKEMAKALVQDVTRQHVERIYGEYYDKRRARFTSDRHNARIAAESAGGYDAERSGVTWCAVHDETYAEGDVCPACAAPDFIEEEKTNPNVVEAKAGYRDGKALDASKQLQELVQDAARAYTEGAQLNDPRFASARSYGLASGRALGDQQIKGHSYSWCASDEPRGSRVERLSIQASAGLGTPYSVYVERNVDRREYDLVLLCDTCHRRSWLAFDDDKWEAIHDLPAQLTTSLTEAINAKRAVKHADVCTCVDGMTVADCLKNWTANNRTADLHPKHPKRGAYALLSSRQVDAARAAWSAELRKRQDAAELADRNQVLVDQDDE